MIRLHYNFYYQMKNPNKIIDSVSASQLLKALSALQQMGEEGEISFSEDSKVRPQGKGHSKVMNFQNYMARKTEGKASKPQGSHQRQHTPAQQRKSISPIRHSHPEHTLKIADLKSRSCSPLTKKPEKTDRSMLVTQKKQPPPPQQAPNKSFHAPSRHAKENKQNKREEPAQSDKLYRASFQSKRILDQKQRKGAAAYVPIQLRTEDLLREKQAKLARLQKEQEMNSILREKECTFKPNIIKNYKKPKRDDPPLQAAPPQQDPLDKIQEQSVRFDEQAENEFLCTPTHPVQTLQSLYEPSEYLFPVEQSEPKAVRKYKNEKFNMLLDLIH